MAGPRILTLDLGNTSLKGLLWEGGEVRARFRREWGKEEPWPDLPRPERILAVAVHGRERAAPPSRWPGPEWVGAELPLPGTVLYRDPQEMGRDRRVACHAALALHGPSLLLDCGTALTLTHVDAEERITGLAISAGYGVLRRGLLREAPALAPFLGPEEGLPQGLPQGTAQNLELGLAEGWAGLCRGLVAEAEARLGSRPGLLLTGTDALRARKALGRGEIEADLIHQGLLLLGGAGSREWPV